MSNLIWRKEAIKDLNKIWKFTVKKWSEWQADKYYFTIKFACEAIGEKSRSRKII